MVTNALPTNQNSLASTLREREQENNFRRQLYRQKLQQPRMPGFVNLSINTPSSQALDDTRLAPEKSTTNQPMPLDPTDNLTDRFLTPNKNLNEEEEQPQEKRGHLRQGLEETKERLKEEVKERAKQKIKSELEKRFGANWKQQAWKRTLDGIKGLSRSAPKVPVGGVGTGGLGTAGVGTGGVGTAGVGGVGTTAVVGGGGTAVVGGGAAAGGTAAAGGAAAAGISVGWIIAIIVIVILLLVFIFMMLDSSIREADFNNAKPVDLPTEQYRSIGGQIQ